MKNPLLGSSGSPTIPRFWACFVGWFGFGVGFFFPLWYLLGSDLDVFFKWQHLTGGEVARKLEQKE